MAFCQALIVERPGAFLLCRTLGLTIEYMGIFPHNLPNNPARDVDLILRWDSDHGKFQHHSPNMELILSRFLNTIEVGIQPHYPLAVHDVFRFSSIPEFVHLLFPYRLLAHCLKRH